MSSITENDGSAAARPERLPVKLAPAFKDYLWGGERLKTEWGKRTDLQPLAESWELSAHRDGPSVVLNGPFAGQTFPAYLQANPSAAGGPADGLFPVLIKLIDAAKPLSVQVHPDDAYAQRVEGEPGKTEMWYIVDAQPGAFLYYGFKREASREEVERRIRDGTLAEILNDVPVHPGDVFFIEAGTLHAIGAGILIAEIQQSSNTTYRVYDYNRRGADGKLRPLHIQKALDVLRLAPPTRAVGPAGQPVRRAGCVETLLASCPYFTVSRLQVSGCAEGSVKEGSFQSLLCIEGKGALLYGEGGSLAFEKGDSLFLPAGFGAYRIDGAATLLATTR